MAHSKEVIKTSTPNITSKRKKRSGLVLLQLFIVAGLLAAVWFSFGQNVLAPRTQSGVTQRFGDMELVDSIEGAEALAQINRLHGTDIKLVSAYIAKYAHSSPYHKAQATIWVGIAESSSAGTELTERMLQAIAKGGSVFSDLQRLTIDGHEIFQVKGPGGEHFFYNSRKTDKQVVWLTIDATDVLPILEQAVKNF